MRLPAASSLQPDLRCLARVVAVTTLVTLAAVQPAFATVTVPLRFETLVGDASTIFRGEVVDVRSEWRQLRGEQVIVTQVRFRVERVLKGSAPVMATLEILGGSIGETTMTVPGMPQFALGDRDLLCFDRTSTLFPVLGASQGRFRILTDRSGRDRVVFSDGRPIGGVAQIGRAAVVMSATPIAPMTLSTFESTIDEEVARARR